MQRSPAGYGAAFMTNDTRRHAMAEGTDMVSVLVTDHAEMKQYFRELEAATDPAERRDIADKLTAEVARHSVAEEIFLYPAARKALPTRDELINDAIKEHSEVE